MEQRQNNECDDKMRWQNVYLNMKFYVNSLISNKRKKNNII